MTKHSTTRKALGALLSVALTGLAFIFATRNIEATTNPVQNALVVLVPTHGTITVTPTSNQGGTATITPSTGTAPSYFYDASPVTQVTVSVSNVDTGCRFTGWTIEKFGSPSTFTYPTTTQTTITMDANYQASANFAQQFTLTTSVASGNGSVAVNPTSSPSSPAGTYDSGTSVTLTATPASGWRFDHWHHEMFNTTPNPATITMDADKTWTAYFVQQYNLTTSVTGSGTITASPTSNPASSPVGTYDAGTGVTLTAAPATGWRFDHWSGSLTGSTNPALLTMGAAKSVTATFVQQFTITKTVAGTGCAILANPPQNPSTSPAGTYDTGSTVSLTPQAASGWRFGRWTTDGAWGGYANPLVFNNMTVNHSVIAYFAIPVTLPIVVSPVGAGSVTPSTSHSWNWEPGLYGKGVTVSLTAVPAEGYCFSHWEGGLAGSANPISYVVNTPTVTAVFEPKHTLTVSASDGGTVTPASGPYCPGSIVSIAATPDTATGWRFLQWVGDITGMADPTNPSNTVTMDADKHISAVFAPEAPELVPDFDAMLTYFYDLNYDDTFAFIFPQDMGSSAEYDHNSWAPGGYYGTFSENQILDGAELALVEHVLENSADPHYAAVMSAWEANYAAIWQRLTELQTTYAAFVPPSGEFTRVWASYACIDESSAGLSTWFFFMYTVSEGLTNEGIEQSLMSQAAAPLSGDADYDADGKSNVVEWTNYKNGGGDFTANPQQWITEEPNLPLVISVEGEGSIAADPPGPLYMPGAQVALTAAPVTDWVLERWWGKVADEWNSPGTTILMDNSHVVMGQFVHRPGMAALDLQADFAAFLVLIGAPGTAATFDRNDTRYDMQGTLHTSPNGIPDAAELYLLERTIKDLRLDLSPWSGAVSDFAWADWEANWTRVQTDLAGLDGAVMRTVAAYMTLGDYDSTEMIMQLVHSVWPAYTLDRQNYQRSQQRFLRAAADADNDGVTNLEEWQAVSTGDLLEDRDAYAAAALDRALPDFSAQSGASQGPPGGDCSCRPSGTVTLNTYLWPWDGGSISPGDTTASPTGAVATWTPVEVETKLNPTFYFTEWYAQGTMIDGSRNTAEQFRFAKRAESYFSGLVDAVTITPGCARLTMQIADATNKVRIEAEPGGGAQLAYDQDGHTYVVGPHNGWVKLTATSLDEDYFVEKIQITSAKDSEDPQFAWGAEAQSRIGGYAQAVLRHNSYTPPNTFEVLGAGDKGGKVYVNGAHLWSALFDGPVQVAGAYAPGTPGQLCDAPFPRNLTAAPWPGYHFERWMPHSPELPQGSTQTTINVGAPQDGSAFYAKFVPDKDYTLDLTVSVEGGGVDECAGYVNAWPAKKYYQYGETVKLKATANYTPGANCAYAFLRWEGDAMASSFAMPSAKPVNQVFADSIDVAMTSNVKITAVFLNLACLEDSIGEQIVYIGCASWGLDTGYQGDIFDHQVTDSGGVPGWNWEGVIVQESMYHIRNDFGLQAIDFHGGAGSIAGSWTIRSAENRVGNMDCYNDPPSGGFWRDTVSDSPHDLKEFRDDHSLSPSSPAIATYIYSHRSPDPSPSPTVAYVEAVQVMRVLTVGPNNSQVENVAGRLYAAHRVTFKFVDFWAGCYLKDGVTDAIAHCLVSKGGQHHFCAYDDISNVVPSTPNPLCREFANCVSCP